MLDFFKEYQLLAVLFGFILAIAGYASTEYLRRWFFSPKIKIDFCQEKPFVIQSRIGNDETEEYYPFYQFRISIYNAARFYTAEKHVVMLTGLWNLVNGRYEEERLFEPIRLNPLGYGPETILPGMSVFSPLGRICHVDYQKRYDTLLSGEPNEPQFRFEAMDKPRWVLSHVAPGKHRFEITVYFENCPPKRRKFEMSWSGQWDDDYKKMLKQILIKPL